MVCSGGPAAGPVQEPSSPIVGRDRLILAELAHDDATVTFTGLRRRIGIHPQSLTRALQRLEEAGDIVSDDGGYRVTEQGHDALHGAAVPDEERTELVRLLLGPDARAEDVVAALEGRWFEGLRWYGKADGPGETRLLWTIDPEGTLVRLRIVGGSLIIEVAAPWDEAGPAFASLRGLITAVADLYGKPLTV